MKRTEVLQMADEIVNGEREEQYGSPEDNFAMIANLWTDYLQTIVTTKDVAHMMILLKLARAKNGTYLADNYVDICGYAACASEIADQ